MKRQAEVQLAVSRVLLVVVVTALGLVNILPILWGVATSLKTNQDILASPPKLVGFDPTTMHYETVLGGNFGTAFMTSVWYALGTTLVGLMIATITAYALNRLRFRLRKFMFYSIVACVPLAIGAAILIVPNYIYLSTLGLTNQWFTLPLIYLGLNLPLATWIIVGAMEGVPTELDQAGKIDGLSAFGVLFRIILPLCRPAIFAAGVLIFIGCWNEFIAGSVMVRDAGLRPVQAAIYQYITAFGREWGALTAAATLAVIPMLVLLFVSGRHLVSGLMRGSVKG